MAEQCFVIWLSFSLHILFSTILHFHTFQAWKQPISSLHQCYNLKIFKIKIKSSVFILCSHTSQFLFLKLMFDPNDKDLALLLIKEVLTIHGLLIITYEFSLFYVFKIACCDLPIVVSLKLVASAPQVLPTIIVFTSSLLQVSLGLCPYFQQFQLSFQVPFKEDLHSHYNSLMRKLFLLF